MPQSQSFSAAQTIARMAQPPRLGRLHPIAARFVHSLRLIALHERAGRDPVPELATRLGSVTVAARSLALGQALCADWPENIHVSRYCCELMSHDEATIGIMVECAVKCDKRQFEANLRGLIRPDRIERLWDATVEVAAAEALLG